jgi:hypothetical protein
MNGQLERPYVQGVLQVKKHIYISENKTKWLVRKK